MSYKNYYKYNKYKKLNNYKRTMNYYTNKQWNFNNSISNFAFKNRTDLDNLINSFKWL